MTAGNFVTMSSNSWLPNRPVTDSFGITVGMFLRPGLVLIVFWGIALDSLWLICAGASHRAPAARTRAPMVPSRPARTGMTAVFRADLDRVVDDLAPLWSGLRGKRLFMTGGTGFIGRWLLEALAEADRRHDLGVEVVVLTRDPVAVGARTPHLAARFHYVAGDVLDFAPDGARYDFVIHAATDASADLNRRDPRRMFDTIVTGTRRALDFAVAAQAERFFFLSSGAVYGAQPWDVTHVAEDWRGGPDCTEPMNAYAEGKRAAEMLCGIYGRQFGLDVVNARIFALLGPLLSLDIHFAAGNFIRDALAGQTIRVEGAGTAVRSYLYAADLTVWLWTILLRAARGATYNAGRRRRCRSPISPRGRQRCSGGRSRSSGAPTRAGTRGVMFRRRRKSATN